MKLIEGVNQEEWKADKLSRKVSRKVFELEGSESIFNILFYE